MTEYTCPMHPEVVQDHPGTCPKCGMALEPRVISLDAKEENPEYRDMKKRLIVGAILTILLVFIAMRDMLPGGRLLGHAASPRTLGWLELVLATPAVLWGGWPFFARAVQSVLNKSLNMFTPLGVPVAAGVLYPFSGILMSPMIAAAAMSFSSVSVVFNALRLQVMQLE